MTTAVKERPILFSSEMVRALLEWRKTMTRRIVKPKNPLATVVGRNAAGELDNKVPRAMPDWQQHALLAACPYGRPGDRLWVRETWLPFRHNHIIGGKRYAYRADGNGDADAERCRVELGYKWKPSIHMPRAASRLTLELTSVRVERVQDISAKDILAEGAVLRAHEGQFGKQPVSAFDRCAYWDLKSLWAAAWNKVNGPGAWERNDWVWVLGFKLVEEVGR